MNPGGPTVGSEVDRRGGVGRLSGRSRHSCRSDRGDHQTACRRRSRAGMPRCGHPGVRHRGANGPELGPRLRGSWHGRHHCISPHLIRAGRRGSCGAVRSAGGLPHRAKSSAQQLPTTFLGTLCSPRGSSKTGARTVKVSRSRTRSSPSPRAFGSPTTGAVREPCGRVLAVALYPAERPFGNLTAEDGSSIPWASRCVVVTTAMRGPYCSLGHLYARGSTT